jgi:F0F1-type ATP synthase membrane subunit b/b'
MHATRQRQFNLIVNQQQTTQQADQQARAEVARRIEEIYQKTKQKAEDRLNRLDKEVNDLFDLGAEGARQAFESYVDSRMTRWKLERYLSKPEGPLLWVKDQFLDLPDEVNAFYEEGRQLYIGRMDKVIDQVAAAVETGLDDAKKTISDGRAEIQGYVEKLPENLRKVGEQAATNIQGKFDALRQSVDDKSNQLVDQLAQKYVDNLQKIDERIDQMKAENRGLITKAKEQIQGVIDTITNLKNMLLGVLAKAAAAIDKIIEDPIGFLGNLVSGVKAGLSKFMSNIGTHLQKGLMEWLFGALAGAGIQIPQSFDLKGIISLVLQVLGLTYANFRARAVAIVGEPIVKTLETAAEVFMTLIREGVAGLWRFIKDKVGDIKSMIMDSILAFVRDRVIISGITWIIGLLNPASAFVKACKAIYDIIMFFVSRGSQIMALVNAVVDSVAAIANGAIGAMVAAIEGALARAIPVAIGFLASLLGLGDISGTIRKTIEKIQAPVNKAIDWVINLAVKGVKAHMRQLSGVSYMLLTPLVWQ